MDSQDPQHDAHQDVSPLEVFDHEQAPSRIPNVLKWAGLITVMVAGAYVAAQWAVADKLPGNASVAGVAVGGMSVGDAVNALNEGLKEPAVEPVAVQAGDRNSTLDPVAAGMRVNAEKTVADLAGFSLNPTRLWDSLFGGGDVAPVIDVDDAAFNTQLDVVGKDLAVKPVDGKIVFSDGTATAVQAKSGQEIDRETARERIVENWLRTDAPIELKVTDEEPAITQEETIAALREANQFLSAPVAVSIGKQLAELPVAVLAEAGSYVANGQSLDLELDADVLAKAVRSRTTKLETKATNARFEFKNGKPAIVGGKDGTSLDKQALAAEVKRVAINSGERTAEVELKQTAPKQSKDKLQELGIKEIVGEFTTPLGASDASRVHNLVFGSQKVTGSLILPGETWSLTETLSPITIAGGYRDAGIVSNGIHQPGVGGGLSQMATTTYNVGFFMGLEDVEHRPHTYWFPRYPAGREATIFVGSIDMRFKNDTPYGILMQAFVKDNQLTVRGWSTKHYRVETTTSPHYNTVPATITHSKAPGCTFQPRGSGGFGVTVTRKVYLKDELVRDESNSWTYRPDHGVVCDRSKSSTSDD